MATPENSSEKDLKRQFQNISFSFGVGIIWLLVNMVLGVMDDLGFQDDPSIPQWKHICFYIWFLLSFFAMIWLLKKIWHR
ncbi:MAG: hypothetical protein ACYCOO_02170 [Chitinophagaceae bacterium]